MPTPTVTDSYLRAARRLFTSGVLDHCGEIWITSNNQCEELIEYITPLESLFEGPKDQHVNLLLLFAAIHEEI